MLNASGPIIFITRYIHQYLQARYILAAHNSTLNNGTDAIQAIETFAKNRPLKATTQFITVEVKDFDLTFTHRQIMKTLKLFLQRFVPRSSPTWNLSYKTIIRLVRLILETQYFMYDNKLYRQIKGSDPESPLTKLLVNIYLLHWQEDLRRLIKQKHEFFGRSVTFLKNMSAICPSHFTYRCYNTMLFTWNGPKRTFYYLFARIKEQLPTLSTQLSMGISIRYLDVQIAHDHGILRTNMCRSGLAERYTIPYLSNHPMHQYAGMIRRHLMYATRSCNHLQDFEEEHSFLYSSYLFNHFPLDFITHCTHQFFNEFNPLKLDYKYNQKTYECLRQCVMMNDRVSSLSMKKKRPNPDDLNTETNIKRVKVE